MVYLDNNSTTRPCDEAVRAVRDAMERTWANPSSVHRAGQDARNVVELARRAVGDLIGVRAGEVTFTSGATEAIVLAHAGVLAALPADRRVVVTSAVEHEAVRESLEALAGSHGLAGVRVVNAEVSVGGVVDVASVERALDAGGVGLVSLQWANNETGVVQPVREIGRACRHAGALFHCDATQWVGKRVTRVLRPTMSGDVDLDAPDPWIDLLSMSAHKFHGPKGVGALVARRGVGLVPNVHGSQEKGRRGGTEAVPLIAGMGAAAVAAMEWLTTTGVGEGPGTAAGTAALRDRLERTLVRRCGGVVNGAGCERLWNTTNIGFEGLEAEALLRLLSERGVAASAGAACSSGSLDPSPVLLAMGVPERVAHGSIRLSLSRETTTAEIEEAIRVITAGVETLRGSLGAVGG